MPYDLTEERRDQYRTTSRLSQARKKSLLSAPFQSGGKADIDWGKRLKADELMPMVGSNGLLALSLFSGGGGLDLGFERCGFAHTASIELLDICGQTLSQNRPDWKVLSGERDGDVQGVNFKQFLGVDVVHGGPPCQPFSIAGKQGGEHDERNMWPDFIRAVLEVKPRAFVAENVPGLLDPKFRRFLEENVLRQLSQKYMLFMIKLSADDFGVPQARKRVFIVGFKNAADAARWEVPQPTHSMDIDRLAAPKNLARRALGLKDIGFDTVAPTLRSGFTGPRNTTGVVNSKASLRTWGDLQIWPNGVQRSREIADAYPPENGHFRLSVQDCALLQGFPEDWKFSGAVYQVLGQIGNSVCPPVSYAVARSVARALGVS